MKSEPLSIHDKKFLINRLIRQAPTDTLIREFFKNADENAALAPKGGRRIEIYPVLIGGVNKLAFWNTGLGMDDRELRQATDLSASINKEMALDGNFGIGAKVSGLTVSPEGIRYRSCKNGRVNEVTIGYDEDEGTYVRFAVELPDGTADTVIDITEAMREEGKPLDFDWTEVVLFGESDDHDTVAEPLKKGKPLTRSYVPTAIFRRFASFSPGVEVKIDVSMTKGGGKDETGRFRRLKTLEEILDQLPRHELVREQGSGIQIRYVHDPKHEESSHSLSARANAATGSTTFCAVVHKGERYDFKTSKAWSAAAPNFGIPFGSRVLTVEIIIPDDLALPNQYRDCLTWPTDRSPMTADDFNFYVRELMPQWVKDVIRAESPEATDNLDDLQKDLQKLLDEFRVPTVVKRPAARKEAERTHENEGDEDTADRVSAPFGEFTGDFEAEKNGRNREGQSGQRARKRKVRIAPEGSKASESSRALERAPEIKILIDPEEINEKEIKGRAGRYYKDSQTLFVNGLYPVVERMAQDLESELSGTGDPEAVRTAALQAARRSMAFRVGKTACYAISKRLADDWTSDDLDKATTPESLSMAADDYKQSLSEAKKYARAQILATRVRETEAA
jgi:hypothetical protein